MLMKIFRRIILIIAIIIFLGFAGYLGKYLWDGHVSQVEFRELKVTEEDPGLEELHAKNHDIVGWISIGDTHVDYPVMQTTGDPEFYLHRNFKKEYSAAGTPFVDAASDMKKPSANWIIYGHNMKNHTMFHDILKYSDQEFYEGHRQFRFDTLKSIHGDARYEVIAAFHSKIYNEDESAFKYYQYPYIEDEGRFNEYIHGIMSLSEIETGETAEYGDQLITLSTCEYHTDDGRFVVVAKKLR
jgi:sortase B